MTVRLSLVCHAATAAMRSASFPADEPLDAHGRGALATTQVAVRADPGRCWTSPASRAAETAEALGFQAIVDPMLRDCDYGRWTGLSLDDVQAVDPEGVAAWLSDMDSAPHGGEPLAVLMARVADWLDTQIVMPGRTVAVTHPAVIRAGILHAIGAGRRSFWRIDVAPLSVTVLSGVGGHWTLTSTGPSKPPRPVPPRVLEGQPGVP